MPDVIRMDQEVGRARVAREPQSVSLQPGTALSLGGLVTARVEFVNPGQMMERALARCEPRIAPIGVVAVRQMQDVCCAYRRVLNLARAAAAQSLVTFERHAQCIPW